MLTINLGGSWRGIELVAFNQARLAVKTPRLWWPNNMGAIRVMPARDMTLRKLKKSLKVTSLVDTYA